MIESLIRQAAQAADEVETQNVNERSHALITIPKLVL